MQTPTFYEPTLTATLQVITLQAATALHCTKVLRMTAGANLLLTNGQGLQAQATIVSIHKSATVVSVNNSLQHTAPKVQHSIAISLQKNVSRTEWFVEKATELGVANIIPLLCKRTERQFFKYERLHTIMVSAMLQSHQTFLPTLHLPIAYTQLLAENKVLNNYIAHCETDKPKMLFTDLISAQHNNSLILIGPEGDFTNTEIQQAVAANYIPVSLGSTRLRTETAGVVAATLLQLYSTQ